MKRKRQKAAEAAPQGYGSHSGRPRMTTARKGCRYILALLALSTLVSCGSGDTLAGGGIGGTGTVSVGPISALGSIFVNGIEYDTARAAIDLNGASADQSMLQVGMVVTVEGTINEGGFSGIATSVVYDDNLQGPISAVDPGAGRITVLDQEIRTDSGTVFETDSSLPGLAGLGAGDVIEVSGLSNADGSIQATRISQRLAGQEVEITGQVSGATQSTFRINGLTVDFSGRGPGMPRMNAPQNGAVVEARGALDNNGILVASQLLTKTFSGANRQMQLEGYIQSTGPGSFTVAVPMGVLTILFDQQTLFTAGTAADLSPGRLVEVSGAMSMGTLSAGEIFIRP